MCGGDCCTVFGSEEKEEVSVEVRKPNGTGVASDWCEVWNINEL